MTPPTNADDVTVGREDQQGSFRHHAAAIWQWFLEANPSDVTSPTDLPEHALMTFDEFVMLSIEMDRRAHQSTGEAEDMARKLCDDFDARVIADQVHAPSFDESAGHVRDYWLAVARAALAIKGGEVDDRG